MPRVAGHYSPGRKYLADIETLGIKLGNIVMTFVHVLILNSRKQKATKYSYEYFHPKMYSRKWGKAIYKWLCPIYFHPTLNCFETWYCFQTRRSSIDFWSLDHSWSRLLVPELSAAISLAFFLSSSFLYLIPQALQRLWKQQIKEKDRLPHELASTYRSTETQNLIKTFSCL